MSDFQRIRNNVEMMATQGAPVSHIDHYLALEGMTAAQFKARNVPAPSLADQALKYSAGSGAANFLDAIPRGVVNAGNLVRAGAGAVGGMTGAASPSQLSQINDNMIPPDQLDWANPLFRKLGLINDQYAPQTAGGRVADFATQAVTGGGVNPAQLGRNFAQHAFGAIAKDTGTAALSGAGAGVGNVLADNIDTGYGSLDALLRAGATLGGGAVGMPIAARGTAANRVAASLKDVSPESLAMARLLSAKASAQGTPLTGYEAIQGITGVNPRMQTQQRLAEQSDAAGAGLTPMMQNRPTANAAAIDQVLQDIAPQLSRPDALAGVLQQASKDAIDTQRNVGNTAAAPYYKSLNSPAARVSNDVWEQIVGDPLMEKALQAVKADPVYEVTRAQPGDIRWIDAAKKWMDDRRFADDATPTEQRVYGNASAPAVALADAAFPNYGTARAITGQNLRDNVLPLQQGQLGKLGNSDDFAAQSAALLPNAPADVTPSVLADTASRVGAENPDILPQFLAQDLRRKFNEANQDNIPGGNVFGGAKFAANVAGNAAQRENMVQLLRSTGTNDAPLQDALSVFRAQGTKPPVNSATAANLAEGGLLGKNGFTGLVTQPLVTLRNAMENYQSGGAAGDLAKILASPTSLTDLLNLSRTNGAFNPAQQQMMINLLLANPQPAAP